MGRKAFFSVELKTGTPKKLYKEKTEEEEIGEKI